MNLCKRKPHNAWEDIFKPGGTNAWYCKAHGIMYHQECRKLTAPGWHVKGPYGFIEAKYCNHCGNQKPHAPANHKNWCTSPQLSFPK